MLQALVRPVKNLLPTGSQKRTIRFGPAAGVAMFIDLHTQFRPYLGVFETELNPWYRRLIASGDDCFDIGMADGYNALMMAKLSGARVLSFEADPGGAQVGRSNCDLNPALSIQVVEAFVGASDAPGLMTIDRAAEEFFPPRFIKMDIEGAEVDALRGASFVLATYRPKWIIEVHSEEKERGALSS